MEMTDREQQYIDESGDKKPLAEGYTTTHCCFWRNYSKWLTKKLEKAETELAELKDDLRHNAIERDLNT